MKNKRYKNRIAHFLIIVFLMVNTMDGFSGIIYNAVGDLQYVSDKGMFAVNCWRWLDIDGNGICECYRFDEQGYLARNFKSKDGKRTNSEGQWVDDGKVVRIYKSTGKPVYLDPGLEGQQDEYEIVYSTDSVTGLVTTQSVVKERRLISKDAEKKVEKQANKNSLGEFRQGPQYVYEGAGEKGFLTKGNIDKSPKFTATRGQVITTIKLDEDEPKYIDAASGSITRVLGRDMRKFEVLGSKKYTEKMENVNIWGGETWDDVFCLAGNGAFVKYDLKGYNYMRVEVAHQTHGESTADTDCRVELYINNTLITYFDEFNDDKPEVIEEWFDDGDKNITLKAVITGDAPGRKIYFKNGRFRKIKDKEE